MLYTKLNQLITKKEKELDIHVIGVHVKDNGDAIIVARNGFSENYTVWTTYMTDDDNTTYENFYQGVYDLDMHHAKKELKRRMITQKINTTVVKLPTMNVHGVYACPKCNAEEYAYMQNVGFLYSTCCDKCDYTAKGAVYARGRIDVYDNPKEYKELSRRLFNMWNEDVAKVTNNPMKRVRILMHK